MHGRSRSSKGDSEVRVEALERRLRELRMLTADDVRVPLTVRRGARTYLHGSYQTMELWSPEIHVAQHDTVASNLFDLATRAAACLSELGNVTNDVWLDITNPLMQRVDDVEVAAWAAFIGRIRLLAGE
jgi:hypothetical protein